MLCAPINSFIKWILCLLYLHRGIKESCISKRIVLTQHFLSIFFSRLSTKYLYDSPYIILSLVLYIRYITIWCNEKGNKTCIVLSTSGLFCCWIHRCNLFSPVLHSHYTFVFYLPLILFCFFNPIYEYHIHV